MSIYLVDYNSRSVAVYGDTKSLKDELKALGGRFNPRLVIDGERKAGWIFPSKMRDELLPLLNVDDEIDNYRNYDYDAEEEPNTDIEAVTSQELPLALRQLVEYKGTDFIFDDKLINALNDYQAFEEHPALRNIFRIIQAEGYIKRLYSIGAWNTKSEKLVSDIVRN